jgi:uncharacterized OsmC-like protein
MPTSTVQYLGDLRTESTHLASGSAILTDAPIDNHGKGEAFSPTDMVANSLATCMLTVMSIKAQEMGIELKGSTAEVTKTMGVDPRRIVKIEVHFTLTHAADERTKLILERIAHTCPVQHSLHPNIERVITFVWAK